MTMIKEPGRFEGEPTYAPYFYDLMLNGDGEDIQGEGSDDETIYTIFGVGPEDVEEFPDLEGVDVIVLWQSNSGLVYTREMTHPQVEAFRKELEA